jgi:hypothetical protein
VDEVIDSARALPDTLEGPMVVNLAKQQRAKEEVGLIEERRFVQPDKPPTSVSGPKTDSGQTPAGLKQELKAEAKGKGRAKFTSEAVQAKAEKKNEATRDQAATTLPGEGQVTPTTKFLEEEKIKQSAVKPTKEKAAPREPLPALKELEDEALIPRTFSSKRNGAGEPTPVAGKSDKPVTNLDVEQKSAHSKES